jgi:Fe-S-cluster-containing hydrogenase component 2
LLKTLYADPDICTGCRRCEAACSFVKNKTFNLKRSAIQVISQDPGGVKVPVFCMQCGICIDACPTKALSRGKAGAVVVDKEKCNGDGLCVMACPFGVIFVDPKTNKAVKCDLCGGNPACVKYCPQNVLKYDDVNVAAHWRRKKGARAFGTTSLYRKLWRYTPKP